MKLSFIGGGAMAEAMIRGVLAQGLARPEEIYVGEISEERCRYLCDAYRIYASPRNEVAATKGELIVLAVKPQNFQDVAPELADHLTSSPSCGQSNGAFHHCRAAHVHPVGRATPRRKYPRHAQHAGTNRRRYDFVAMRAGGFGGGRLPGGGDSGNPGRPDAGGAGILHRHGDGAERQRACLCVPVY